MLAVMKKLYLDEMTKAAAVERAGSQAALADVLGISRQAVSKWGYEIPLLQLYRLRDVKPEWFREARRKAAA